MRKTITISVSDEMHELIRKGMRASYSDSVSEYLRFLVRRDQSYQTVRKQHQRFEMPKPVNEIMRMPLD